MKELIIFVTFYFLCMLVACEEKEDRDPAIRRIINETSFDVRIEVFGDEENKFNYLINAQDSINIEGFCNSNIVEYCLLDWRGDLAFANILFNEERVLNFEQPSGNSNEKFINADPLGGYGYQRSDEKGVTIYTYRITHEDYENAELISE